MKRRSAMQPEIELEVAGVFVDTSLARDEAERLGTQLERAFALLAERLGGLPMATRESLRELVIEQLVIDLDNPARALGSAGAELLADQLLEHLLARTQV